MSEITAKTLETLFKQSDALLKPKTVIVTDKSIDNYGQMFEVILVSDAFIGMPLLKRHRLVNDVGKDVISRIHAFSQKCYTEQQWNERKEKEAIE